VENVLGPVPLLPCYMMGNKQNTTPHALRYHVSNGAAADSRPNSGSCLFEVNIWMWRYGRAFPRKISVRDAEEMLRSRVSESSLEAPSLGCCRTATGINWLVFVVYDIVYYIVYDIVLHIVYDVVCTYDIVYDNTIWNIISYTMSYTMSYVFTHHQ
jgi:hypothetical protein